MCLEYSKKGTEPFYREVLIGKPVSTALPKR